METPKVGGENDTGHPEYLNIKKIRGESTRNRKNSHRSHQRNKQNKLSIKIIRKSKPSARSPWKSKLKNRNKMYQILINLSSWFIHILKMELILA